MYVPSPRGKAKKRGLYACPTIIPSSDEERCGNFVTFHTRKLSCCPAPVGHLMIVWLILWLCFIVYCHISDRPSPRRVLSNPLANLMGMSCVERRTLNPWKAFKYRDQIYNGPSKTALPNHLRLWRLYNVKWQRLDWLLLNSHISRSQKYSPCSQRKNPLGNKAKTVIVAPSSTDIKKARKYKVKEQPKKLHKLLSDCVWLLEHRLTEWRTRTKKRA